MASSYQRNLEKQNAHLLVRIRPCCVVISQRCPHRFPPPPCRDKRGLRIFNIFFSCGSLRVFPRGSIVFLTPAVTSLRVRPLHGYWDSPEISSAFPWRQRPDTGSRVLPCRRALLRRYTGYSFVGLIILCGTGGVKECQGSVLKMFFIE